jgi:transposase
LRLLLSFEALSDAERGAWLRREGLHDAELQVWRQELEDALDDSKPEVAKSVHPNKRIRQLEREVQRKDKALAEAAALLLLQKKVRAFWEAEDDDTQEKNGP